MAKSGSKSRIMALLLILFLLLGQLGLSPAPSLAANAVPKNTGSTQGLFKDVPQSNPNFVFINFLSNRGILKGFSDGSFQPAASLTRAQAAAVLVKAAGLKTAPAQAVFRDVNPTYWAAASIAAAKDAGLLNGYPDGTFRPEAKLTRAEGIILILKLSKEPDPGVALPVLADISSEHWAARAAAVGLASEMIGLSSDNKRFMPDTPLTRGSLSRALAVLLTKDPALYGTNLTNRLNVVTGPVTVSRAGGRSPETVAGSTEVQAGDTVNTGASGLAEITFPDGTGLRLEKNSQLVFKEATGRSYIKPDGTPGTAVEWLAVDLKSGKMFGALATNTEATGKTASAQARAMGLGNLPENRVRTAAAAAKPLPWWQKSGAKRTKVKIDMPTGVAAIRGTFWENIVNPDGSFDTTLLTGSAEVTAGGKSVDLTAGQRTEVAAAGTAPAAPGPLTKEDKKEWIAQKTWAQERATVIQAQQEQALAPPPPAEKPEQPKPEPAKPQQPQQPQNSQNPAPGQPESPVSPGIDDLIQEALDKASEDITTVEPTIITDQDDSEVRVTGITLNTTSLSLVAGGSPYTAAAHISPDNATNKSLTWTSNSPSVATVSNGVITPVSAGSAVITATTVDGSFSASCYVTVTASTVHVTGVQLDTSSASIALGGSPLTVTAHVYPDNATNKSLNWTSSSPSVATVTSSGVITAVSAGSAVITATTVDGSFSATCTVTVTAAGPIPVTGVQLDRASANLTVGGEPLTVTAHVYPDNATNASLLWSSSDASVADVTYGIITPLSEGTVTITVTTADGGFSDSLSVTVASIPVTGILLDTHSTTLIAGDSPLTVTAQLNPADASSPYVFWTSSNPSVAAVVDGVITPMSGGYATIYATTIDGGYTDSCVVTVLGEGGTTPPVNNTIRISSEERASLSATGLEGTDSSGGGEAASAVSADGRYIAFFSYASNLVTGDTNGSTDIFVRDRVSGTTVRVSVDSNGNQGNSGSRMPGISASGRYVVYTSGATNLVAGDTNGSEDVFVHDRDTDNDGVYDEPGAISTTRVNLASDGTTQANYGSFSMTPAISADGRYVTFYSDATTLVTGDTNAAYDIFVHDMQTGTTQRISVSTGGAQANANSYYPIISGNGRYVAYYSSATNLVPGVSGGIFVRDLVGNTTTYMTSGNDPVMSYDGRYLAYYAANDVYIRDRDMNSSGVFDQVYQDTKATFTIDGGATNSYGYKPSISGDGRYVAFTSHATNLVPNDTNNDSDIFVIDTVNRVTKRVSVPLTGGEANDGSWYQAMSSDGSTVVFTSDATNLVKGDTNIKTDVFAVRLNPNSPPDTNPPTAPTGLSSENSGPSWVNLTWNPATDEHNIVRYSIRRSTNSVGPFDEIGSVYGNVYSYWDTNLAASTTYYYFVQAQDEDGNISPPSAPVLVNTTGVVSAEPSFVPIAAGNYYSMARLIDSSVWGWGQNYYGNLGINSTTNTSTPQQAVYNGANFTGVTAIDAYNHTLALKSDGTVWAWGINNNGQLGMNPSSGNSLTPIQVAGLANIKAVAVGEFHSLALGSDGTVWSWGSNDKGQLGNRFGSGVYNNYTPMRVVSPDGTGYLTDIIAITSGYETSMALKSDGTVWAWGFNNWGDLGQGIYDNNSHPIPVQVAGLTDIIAISGGYDHFVALKSDGTVWAWGTNGSGELGNESTATRVLSPVQVHDPGDPTGYLTGVTAIAAGWYHTLALKSNGSVWAWGNNGYQQLGNNSWSAQSKPIAVFGLGGTGTLSGVTAIAADYDQSLALTIDGKVLAWGYNSSGQLGDGTTAYKGYPVQVLLPAIP